MLCAVANGTTVAPARAYRGQCCGIPGAIRRGRGVPQFRRWTEGSRRFMGRWCSGGCGEGLKIKLWRRRLWLIAISCVYAVVSIYCVFVRIYSVSVCIRVCVCIIDCVWQSAQNAHLAGVSDFWYDFLSLLQNIDIPIYIYIYSFSFKRNNNHYIITGQCTVIIRFRYIIIVSVVYWFF